MGMYQISLPPVRCKGTNFTMPVTTFDSLPCIETPTDLLDLYTEFFLSRSLVAKTQIEVVPSACDCFVATIKNANIYQSDSVFAP